ncbi:MAG: hypothetical protein D6698_04055, partial [Gammaproteobacteria bacterium]
MEALIRDLLEDQWIVQAHTKFAHCESPSFSDLKEALKFLAAAVKSSRDEVARRLDSAYCDLEDKLIEALNSGGSLEGLCTTEKKPLLLFMQDLLRRNLGSLRATRCGRLEKELCVELSFIGSAGSITVTTSIDLFGVNPSLAWDPNRPYYGVYTLSFLETVLHDSSVNRFEPLLFWEATKEDCP